MEEDDDQASSKKREGTDTRFVIPEDIDDDVFAELKGLGGADDSDEDVDDDGDEDEELDEKPGRKAPPADTRVEQLQQQMSNVTQSLASIAATLANKPSTEGGKAAIPIEDRIRAKLGAGATPEAAKLMVEVVQEAVGDDLREVKGAVAQMAQILVQKDQQERNSATMTDFNSYLDGLMIGPDKERPLIAGSAQRRMMRSAIIQEGVQTFGNQFDKAKAGELFKSLYREFSEEQREQMRGYVGSKKGKRDGAAPKSHASSSASVAQGIKESRAKGGKDWRPGGKNTTALAVARLKNSLLSDDDERPSRRR